MIQRVLAVGALALLAACGDGSTATGPSAPVPVPGQFTGKTDYGREVSFVVSPSRQITSLSVDYGFGKACGGANRFENLHQDFNSWPSGEVIGGYSVVLENGTILQVIVKLSTDSLASGSVAYSRGDCFGVDNFTATRQ